MLYMKPQYHPMAMEALIKLNAEGIICTPDEIIWLHQEARRATRLAPGESPILDLPLIVGNATLWPLTFGANEWLTHYCRPLYMRRPADGESRASISDHYQILCLAFAMQHSRSPDVFAALTTRARIIWRVCHWAAKLTCSLRELALGVDRVLNVDDVICVDIPTPRELADRSAQRPPAQPDYSGHGETLALLCHFYGGTPAYWLWEISGDRIAELIVKLAHILPGSSEADSNAKVVAISQFRAVVQHIRAVHAPVDQGPKLENQKPESCPISNIR